MDKAVIYALQPLVGRWPLVDALGMFLATALIWAEFASLAAFFAADRRRYLEAGSAFAAAALSWLVNQGIGLLWFRPRPFVDLPGVRSLIAVPELSKSFPSDHAALSFAVAVSVFLVDRRWGIAFLAMACLVAFGRVFAGVHYPTDALAGAAVGAVSACLIHSLAHRFLHTVHKKTQA